MVEDFKYLGTALANQNSIQEEQIEVRKCLLSFGADFFCLPCSYPKF
jgi:hypothetical protein